MKAGGMKHWFQTYDDKNRLVKSHLISYAYPSDTTSEEDNRSDTPGI